MWSEDEPPGVISILGPPAIAALSVYVLHLLPNEVLAILTAWTLSSFPIGVLIGHCVLSEE
jgi:Kef-type K+ transport system membrane component KefB